MGKKVSSSTYILTKYIAIMCLPSSIISIPPSLVFSRERILKEMMPSPTKMSPFICVRQAELELKAEKDAQKKAEKEAKKAAAAARKVLYC